MGGASGRKGAAGDVLVGINTVERPEAPVRLSGGP